MAAKRRARTRRRRVRVGMVVGGGIVVVALCMFLAQPLVAPDRDGGESGRHAVGPNDGADMPFVRLAAPADGGPTSTERHAHAPTDSGIPQPSRIRPGETGSAELAVRRRRVETGLNARSAGELLKARDLLKSAVSAGLPEAEESVVRAALIDIANRSVFGPERIGDDPLTDDHVVQGGEVLDKIARRYGVTADLLASINGIRDKNRIRIGQRLKVVNGPLHAVIDKRRYLCQVFLTDVLVAEFPVGLGEYDGTPTGEWIVKDKLTNPTYYPPASRGGPIIAADDPENPLGEFWIGLKGVSGDAVGQFGYGIHGTVEPDSIGRNVSLGCVRLRDGDIERLFAMLTVDQSRVLIE